MNQQELDAMHGRIMNAVQQYQSGIMMMDEMLGYFEGLFASYEDSDIVGLIDPATGLKYPETFLPNT
jgi:hypothetical protein